MDSITQSPDLLKPPSQKPASQIESRRTVLFLFSALIFLIINAAIGGYLIAAELGFKPGVILAHLKALTLAREKMLKGEETNRINILLLGMGGVGHEGATLTDTIIVLSLRPSDKKIGRLSIPRDLLVKTPSRGLGRVNSINAYAELEAPGTGAAAVAQTLSEIIDQPIHYYIRLDFKAFKEIIDTVGGIEVTVERAFYDPLYPDENYGYSPVSFQAGHAAMNGETSLKFARSRHGTNGEGSDFARSRRQQKILLALKERFLSFDVLLRPQRLKSILESLSSNIQTNVAFWEGVRLTKLLKNLDQNDVITRVIDDGPEGVLVARQYNGAFMLEPRNGDWSEVRRIATELINQNETIPSSAPKNAETTLLEIQNGTNIPGLAAKTKSELETIGFRIAEVGNAETRDVQNTLIYDLTSGRKNPALEKLKQKLNAQIADGRPTRLLSQRAVDFIVILGQNATP
ncbi:MAG: Cell envelope-related transcriptional attenuator [Parcubacteria group bacterium GW2011_GWC2_45_7]|nr:MAG: Cell envelope-related transcriptional attenuator [Parcubacteria group bacterium GW2011_GWC2_45_7]